MKRPVLSQLWSERSKRFWQEVAPYLRLAGGSLPGIAFIGMFALFLYDRLLEGLPSSYPVVITCVIILTYAMQSIWVRTFLKPADLQYLLPLEGAMNEYFKRGLRIAYGLQSLKIILYWSFLWPLYRLSESAAGSSYAALLAVLLVMKGLSVYFWWEEQRIRDRRMRLIYYAIRVVLTIIVLSITLLYGVAAACAGLGISSLVYLLLLRLPAKVIVAWERLIALEGRRRAQWRKVLNQFVEMQNDQPNVWNNPIARLAKRIPFRKKLTYRYLYYLTWARSPIFGITLRLTLVGTVVAAIAEGIWLQAGIVLMFALGLRLQLKELAGYHRYDDWSYVFPIHEKDRVSSVRVLCLQIWIVAIVVMSIPLLLLP